VPPSLSGEWEEAVSFFNVVAWGDLAEHVGEPLFQRCLCHLCVIGYVRCSTAEQATEGHELGSPASPHRRLVCGYRAPSSVKSSKTLG
jgi:hypothetical protein